MSKLRQPWQRRATRQRSPLRKSLMYVTGASPAGEQPALAKKWCLECAKRNREDGRVQAARKAAWGLYHRCLELRVAGLREYEEHVRSKRLDNQKRQVERKAGTGDIERAQPTTRRFNPSPLPEAVSSEFYSTETRETRSSDDPVRPEVHRSWTPAHCASLATINDPLPNNIRMWKSPVDEHSTAGSV
ncbi:hypothetical protein F5Y19DRAFT_486225 [Xylariaceae sp. FL1651]|nr:hypothetical protein F5Y19DRAFT_486225 [Xylariaceae sp. FL1651]